ncbi:hypothetical protein PQU92_14540 [Asticcacaulis sp. BYS171W]|uniref:Uncharacterized protein n=1 Tax=Asticcacaulis aquaticus TaxID=2984212 RepID=A0ABT5HWT3_9CAUL|nr:hypothetical protein [Asticcacaulis aquaticus]MDC7684499.1 hypothetical protein [Asticcacaulis aquaticus]
MRTLFSQSVKRTCIEPERPDYVDATLLAVALQALQAGTALPDLESFPPIVVKALTALADSLQKHNETLLIQAVEQSQQASNAMAATAHITAEVKTARIQAQHMSDAVTELNQSVTQISDTARAGPLNIKGAPDYGRVAVMNGLV